MKPIQKILVLASLLCSFTTLYAQNGYEDPYGANNRTGETGYGRRRNQPMRDISKLSKKEQENIREENISKTIEKLKSELLLDELQLIVISKVVSESQKKQNNITSSDRSEEDKITEIEAVLKNTDREIISFLNKDQKNKFELMIEDRGRKLELLKNQRGGN